MEHKEIYNPMNDTRVIVGLLIAIMLLAVLLFVLHKFNIIKPLEVIVPDIR